MIKVNKRIAILMVLLITALLSVLLLSEVDADVKYNRTYDKRVVKVLKTGGIVKTQNYALWELDKYKMTLLPRKYPFRFCPWVSYLLIDKNVTVSCDLGHNYISIDDTALYARAKAEAEANKETAKKILKKYKVKGTGRDAYKNVRKYLQTCDYKMGYKSASDFFKHNGGDCVGYTSAVYVLCNVQGIPVRWCMGGVDGGELHAWNRVKFGKKWYWVDETWDYAPSRTLWDDHRKPMEQW